MDKKQEAFLLELISDFKIEAAEHHKAIVNGLLKLEKNPPVPDSKSLIETVFREIHSLKGAARAVNLMDIERLCQSIESVFHLAKQGTLMLSAPLFDILYKAVDILGVMLLEVEVKDKRIGANTLSQLMKRIELQISQSTHDKIDAPAPLQDEQIKKEEVVVKPAIPPVEMPQAEKIEEEQPEPVSALDSLPLQPAGVEKPASSDTVRIATSKLGVLLREAEEFISVKATLGFYIKELKKKQFKELNLLVNEMEQFHRSMSRMVDDLLLDIKTTLLYPFSSLLEIVPKIVRDLGKSYNKEIKLTIHGGEIEIDRRILEEIKDPLIHLIRNCIDHGIEPVEIRKQAGKISTGSLEISVIQITGRDVELHIHDDGAGIDKARVIKSALKMGIVTNDAISRMTDKEIYNLIFRSGVSTSPFITDISGRGLGMAIVAEKVSNLGGNIAMDSIPGQGTTFVISLPVTLSTFRGILIRINEQLFIIPTTSVERAIRVFKKDIKSVESKQIITQNNESFALVRVGDVLGLPHRKSKNDVGLPMPVLILTLARKKIAFMVDEVLGEQEGMVKHLGPQLVHVRNIAGATVLGNGRVIPILNVEEMMESATHVMETAPDTETSGSTENSEGGPKHILVAEDSITLRSLLRNIIESSGYSVKTAVDGMEALQFLKNETFDLVVSDVEMPRLNGFDLTAKIRGDKRLSDIPVILVTALDSADDRQKGMESGANAYIIKGSFEQSNLTEMIKRLI
jgi:two-component system chemotaxis sensor kinase CheA